MPAKHMELLAGFNIPQSCCLVVTAGHDHATIWRERDMFDRVGVADELAYLLVGLGIPEADGLVSTAGKHISAIGRECGTVDRPGMADKELSRVIQRRCTGQCGISLRGVQSGKRTNA